VFCSSSSSSSTVVVVVIIETFLFHTDYLQMCLQRVYDEDVNVTESKDGEKQPEDKVSQCANVFSFISVCNVIFVMAGSL